MIREVGYLQSYIWCTFLHFTKQIDDICKEGRIKSSSSSDADPLICHFLACEVLCIYCIVDALDLNLPMHSSV